MSTVGDFLRQQSLLLILDRTTFFLCIGANPSRGHPTPQLLDEFIERGDMLKSSVIENAGILLDSVTAQQGRDIGAVKLVMDVSAAQEVFATRQQLGAICPRCNTGDPSRLPPGWLTSRSLRSLEGTYSLVLNSRWRLSPPRPCATGICSRPRSNRSSV